MKTKLLWFIAKLELYLPTKKSSSAVLWGGMALLKSMSYAAMI